MIYLTQKTLPEKIKDISNALSIIGGTAYLVGGSVLDLYSNKPTKDWDIEVFGLSYQQILDVANEFGKADIIGAKFGVIKLKVDNLDLELAVPRTENNIGPSHKDFDIELTPNLTIFEAARRRDLTINAVYLEIDNMKVHDPFGGLQDYKKGIIQHIDPKTFIEDPLRAFRVMQLVARKGKRVTQECVELCKSMKKECFTLPGDSIYGEFVKMLMLSNRPDRGLRFLERSELIDLFPELKALINCKQNLKYHPEGDVFIHTKLVLREAAKYRDELPEEWRLAYMFAMMLHDVGKPDTLDLSTYTTYSHDEVGAPIAKKFMDRITDNPKLTEKIKKIVRVHMRPRSYLSNKAGASAWRKLHNKCPLQILAYVSIADRDGRSKPPEGKDSTIFKECMRMHEVIGGHPENIPAMLTGKHLIEAGYKPGVDFGVMLNKAYQHQIETNCTDIEELLKWAAM